MPPAETTIKAQYGNLGGHGETSGVVPVTSSGQAYCARLQIAVSYICLALCEKDGVRVQKRSSWTPEV